MDSFAIGSVVSVKMPWQMADATSAHYVVLDDEQVAVVPQTSLTVEGTTAQLAIPAETHTLPNERLRRVYGVTLTETGASGLVVNSTYRYAIVGDVAMTVPTQSFQSYERALATALGMTDVVAWDAADDGQRVNALMEATYRINRLNFDLIGATEFPDYPALGSFDWRGQIASLSASEWANLPDAFVQALRLAQVAEADAILAGDRSRKAGEAGLKSQTIGETSATFRDGGPVPQPICSRALGYLSRFVKPLNLIGRA